MNRRSFLRLSAGIGVMSLVPSVGAVAASTIPNRYSLNDMAEALHAPVIQSGYSRGTVTKQGGYMRKALHTRPMEEVTLGVAETDFAMSNELLARLLKDMHK